MRRKVLLVFLLAFGCHAATLDLTRAVVYAPPAAATPEKKAVAMLVDEIEKRTEIRLPVTNAFPQGAEPVIAVGAAAALRDRLKPDHAARPEGYRIEVAGRSVFVAGDDPRGVLFGAGRLLRSLEMSPRKLAIQADLKIHSAPRVPLRGHQLGYRPKTNSYDGWTVAMWEQYIRDLAVFGANAVELIPPRSDDDDTSPHFPLPPMQMMVEMSRLLADYGLDVWIWYPAMDKDYADPATVEFALKEWGEVFRQLPKVDAVFVPGGDPGHTQPRHLMALLEKQTANLRRYHPKAQMWVSPQSFSAAWMDEFFDLVKAEPAWLAGVVYGPQTRLTLRQLRERLPKRYPIRLYPDITHTLNCQFPVPDWDTAYALTLNREPINPRPLDQARIFRLHRDDTIGFLTYSEGANDDLNKAVWSALGWDPEARVEDVLREFSRYFIGPPFAEGFAQGLLALERNWRGPLLASQDVYTTLAQFQAMERAAPPSLLLNWRFQQALYRAYYDAYTRRRLILETEAEQQARDRLRDARRTGSLAAMEQAERLLVPEASHPWRSRVFELAEALFQSLRMQLSVERYKAIAVGRGANLDLIDYPLNNRLWWKQNFAEVRKLAGEPERLNRLAALLDWENPGPGGFYDDLGNPARQPHLVREPGWHADPSFLESPRSGWRPYPELPVSSWNYAETHYDTPLRLRYTGLDPAAQYRVRVMLAGEFGRPVKLRLIVDDIEVHPWIEKRFSTAPLEFDIPRQATADGGLTLAWMQEPGAGGNGRGVQISEVWLVVR